MSNRSLLDEPADLDAEVGSLTWCRGVARKIRFEVKKLDSDVKSIQEWILIAAKSNAWKVLGYISLDAFLIAEANFTESIIEAIRSAKPGTKIGDAIAKAESMKELQKRGPKPKSGDSTKFVEIGSTNSNQNVLRRLARDNPELLNKIEAGELTVNQAAIQAGIRKRPTPEEAALKAFGKAQERLQVVRSILDALSDSERQIVKDWLSER